MSKYEVEQILKRHGFVIIRVNGHIVYGKGPLRIVLSHDKLVSPGVMRKVMRTIQAA